MNPQTISLGEFLKQLTLRLRDRNIRMPFANERPWHNLFYALKKEADAAGKPTFLGSLFFDWNGRYPRSQDLSEYIHALHYTGCLSASNPYYDEIKVNEGVARLWSEEELQNALNEYLVHAADVAERYFAQQAAR